MLPEAGVLNRDKRVDQILREFLIGRLDPVGIASHQGVRHFAGAVVDGGKIAAGSKAVRIKARRTVKNPPEHPDPHADSCHGDEQEQD